MSWKDVPTKRKKVLDRALHEVLIELRVHYEHAIPKADQVEASKQGMNYDDWLSRWDAAIRWNIQTWIKAGDLDPASIKKRARALAGIPSRFFMKAKPAHSLIDYTALLAHYERTYGKPFAG